MAHEHEVQVTGAIFEVDPITRKVTSKEKRKLISGDHQSTRWGFTMPRFVSGHDMSLCQEVTIHTINATKDGKSYVEDIYLAGDYGVDKTDDQKVSWTWLVTKGATKLEGKTGFGICFRCLTDGGVDYDWNTELCKDLIDIGEGQHNEEVIEEMYFSFMEQWWEKLLEESGGGGTPDAVQYIPQELTEEQQEQVRTNIGAASKEEVSQLREPVPDYIKEELERVVKNVFDDIGKNAKVFIMLADPHYSHDNEPEYLVYTVPAVKMLSDKLSPDAICILGDEIIGYTTKNQAISNLGTIQTAFRGINTPMIRVIGNHDYNNNSNSEDTTPLISHAVLERFYDNNVYYDFDDVRLICLQSIFPGQPFVYGFTDETITFLTEALDASKKCICIAHVPATRFGDGIAWLPNNHTRVVEVVDAFVNRGGKFLGWFCGHAHYERFGLVPGKEWYLNFLANAFEQNVNTSERSDDGAVGYKDRENGDAKRILFYVVIIDANKVKIRHVGSGSDYEYAFSEDPLLSSKNIGDIVKLPRSGYTAYTDYLFMGVTEDGQSILVDTISRGDTAFCRAGVTSGTLDSLKYIGSAIEERANIVKGVHEESLFGSVTFTHDCAGEYQEEIASGYFPVMFEEGGTHIAFGGKVYGDLKDHMIFTRSAGNPASYYALNNAYVDSAYKSLFVDTTGAQRYSNNAGTTTFRGIAIIKAGAKITSENEIYI